MTDTPFTPVANPPVIGHTLCDGFVDLGTSDSPWGLIGVRGADATRFLHSQTTNDFALLRADEARLAGYCSPKGRLLASFVALRVSEEGAEEPHYLLICRRNLVATVLKRLRMYVLRSKVQIEDATGSMGLHGLLGDVALQAWQAAPNAPAWTPWAHARQTLASGGTRHLVAAYPAAQMDAALPRAWCLQPLDAPRPEGQALPLSDWEWAEVRSGVAMVAAETQEAFVPQMLNYESVGGINFKKGCYPGQEVVARSQFRGAIKRRAYVALAAADADTPTPLPGTEIWSVPTAADAQEAEVCGLVAQCARAEHGMALIAELRIESADQAAHGTCELHVGAPEGAELLLQPLPYPLREDI